MVMRIAHVDANNRVINLSLSESSPESSEPDERGIRYLIAGAARIGDDYIDGHFVTPPPPPPTRDDLKAARQVAVEAIKVEVTGGKVFDGDEISQGRMARAIIGLQAAGVPSITWTLADNTSVQVTLAELIEALILAGQEQARLWVLPTV